MAQKSIVNFLAPDGSVVGWAHFGVSDRAATDAAREILDAGDHTYVEVQRVDAEQQTTDTWFVS